MVPSKIFILPTNITTNLHANLHTRIPTLSPRNEVLQTSVVPITVSIKVQKSKGEHDLGLLSFLFYACIAFFNCTTLCLFFIIIRWFACVSDPPSRNTACRLWTATCRRGGRWWPNIGKKYECDRAKCFYGIDRSYLDEYDRIWKDVSSRIVERS